MRASVHAGAEGFALRFEGKCAWPYLDVLGLVTTWLGNLIDPVSTALPLAWEIQQGPSSRPALREEILAGWAKVKDRQDLKSHGGSAFADVSPLRLSDQAGDALFFGKLDAIDLDLAKAFAGYPAWPADAQMGALSMAYAMGIGRIDRRSPAFEYPKFAEAVDALDFTEAADECAMQTKGNPGLIPRNAANRVLFTNAAIVGNRGLDPDKLYWPEALTVDDV